MGFTSTDDLLNKITTLGKFFRLDFSKVLNNLGTVIAGKWFDLFGFSGYPCQGYYGNMVLNGDFMASQYPWTTTFTWSYTAATHLMSHGTANDSAVLSQTTKCIPGEKYTLVWSKGAGAGAITPSLGGTNGTSRTTASTIFREDIICGTGAGAPLSFTTTDATASVVDQVWLFKSADFYPCTSETEGAMYLGTTPAVGETKHLINWSAFNNALLGSPAVLELVDIVGVYPGVKANQLWKQTLQHSTRLRNGQFVGAETGWTLGTNWTYGTNSIVRAQAANVTTLSQTGLDILAGVPYRLKYTMSGSSGVGTITPTLGTVAGTPRTADGTYTETITPTVTGGDLVFTPTNNNIATTITDVSLIPLFPRYTDGAGLRFYAMTSQVDNVPGANASAMLLEYRNTAGWPTYTTVDACDTATGWNANDSANMTTTLNTTIFKSGVGALNLTKDSVTTALTSTSKTTTSVNMTGKKLTLWYYCNSAATYAKLAAAAALIVRFGTDSTHYYQWSFANTALLTQSLIGVGWVQLECSLLNYTSKTANTVDLTAMVYTYIGLTATDGTTITWAAGEIVIDQIEIVAEASQLGATTNIGTTSLNGQIAHSGVAAGNFAPFIPMQAGDTGVQRIESVTIATASTNAASLCIVVCKPLASIPLPYGFVAAERDFMSQLPSLPQIQNGACLGLLLFTGAVTAAGTMYAGNIDIAWG